MAQARFRVLSESGRGVVAGCLYWKQISWFGAEKDVFFLHEGVTHDGCLTKFCWVVASVDAKA
jgi:hypothetical protein